MPLGARSHPVHSDQAALDVFGVWEEKKTNQKKKTSFREKKKCMKEDHCGESESDWRRWNELLKLPYMVTHPLLFQTSSNKSISKVISTTLVWSAPPAFFLRETTLLQYARHELGLCSHEECHDNQSNYRLWNWLRAQTSPERQKAALETRRVSFHLHLGDPAMHDVRFPLTWALTCRPPPLSLSFPLLTNSRWRARRSADA